MADHLERRNAVSIIYSSHQGCTRFGEFRQALGEIPPGTLTQRLVELEKAGVLRREVRDERPPRVAYELSETGAELARSEAHPQEVLSLLIAPNWVTAFSACADGVIRMWDLPPEPAPPPTVASTDWMPFDNQDRSPASVLVA